METIGVSKFTNINNVTCYMNSILHILQQIPLFVQYISQIKFRESIMKKIDKNKEELLEKQVIFELFRIFKMSLENDDKQITPKKFKHIIGTKNDMWNENNHQDSQEFFTFLITQLKEEVGLKCEFIPGLLIDTDNILSINASINNIIANNLWGKFQYNEYSPLNNMFEGMTQNIKRCAFCGSNNINYEPFLTLGLSIPIKDDINKTFTINECLDHLITEDQLDEYNKITCELCGLKNNSYNKSLIWRTPKVLVLHIKRFMTNQYGIPTQKLTNNILYPYKDLDLSPYFDETSPFKSSSKYDLIGINIHMKIGNNNSNLGHYVSIVKNMINHKWYLYNDASSIIKIKSSEQLQHKNAYMLFYYRHN